MLAKVVESELRSAAENQPKAEVEVSIIRQILGSELPQDEKTPRRIALECSSVTLAGTETSGSLLCAITYYLLNNPDKLSRLQDELEETETRIGRPHKYRELRDLPYLVCIPACLRF